MKKNKLFAVLVSILMFATVFMSGCAFFKGANKLELTEMPKSTYTLTQNWEATEESLTAAGFAFAIKLTKGEEVTTYVFGKTATGNEVQLTYDGGFKVGDLKIFDLVDFNLSKAGKFTAKIKGEGAICTFVYTVKDLSKESGFARGSGVEGDPYIIENEDQFMLLDSTSNSNLYDANSVKYFKLNADIDLSGKMGTHKGWNVIIKEFGNLVLDGNGHKLYNFGQKDGLYNVFGWLKGTTATFSNLDFYLNGINLDFIIQTPSNSTLTFNRVNAFGNRTKADGNTGVYTIYTYGKLYFNDCKNYCNVDSTDEYISAFAGYPLNDVSFTNCVNYGDVAAKMAAAFICNTSGLRKATFVNCDNKGKMISVADSNMLCAVSHPDSNLTKEGKLESSKLLVDQTTYDNVANRANMVVMTGEQYLEKCAFNSDAELEIKLKADKQGVTRIVVTANYLPSYVLTAGGEYGTTRQYIKEEITDITSDVMKPAKILNYKVKVLETLDEGVKAATNDNAEWSVVNNSYVIKIDQVSGPHTLVWSVKDGVVTKLDTTKEYKLSYAVFIYVGNELVDGKVL